MVSFGLFLKKQIKYYLFFLLVPIVFTSIFSFIFYLYNLPLEASLFAGGICFFTALTGILFHLFHSWKKFCLITRFARLPYQELSDFPTADSATEQSYQKLALSLLSQLQTAETRWNSYQQQTTDYYTTWVHQIKAPIAAMRLMLQSSDSDEYRELQEELFYIEQYVEMVLGYARLESDSSDLVLSHFPLDKTVRSVIRRFAPLFIRKRIRLIYEGTDQTVLSDEKWLHFLLEQLISNAIKYTNQGSVSITVNGQCLSIADTGIGIAEQDLPRIFEKGFTGYNGRSESKSTGIGLYLAKQTAKRLGHRLSVRSTVGKGSVFTLDLSQIPLEIE